MKYLITESQLNLISELDRHWMDFKYEEQYEKLKHNWHNMDLNKFKSAITSYVIVDLCTRYSDVCYGNGDFYNQTWEFLLNHYSDEMEERWEKINSGIFG